MRSQHVIFDVCGRDLLITRDFTAAELKARRQRIAAELEPGSRLLIAGAPPVPHDHPLQDAIFYYFCGLEMPHAYLLIEGGTGRSVVYLASRDIIDGNREDKLGHEDADFIRARLDLDGVEPNTALTGALRGIDIVYTPLAEVEGGGATRFGANGCAQKREAEEWDQAEPRQKRLVRLLAERFPGMEVRDACPFVNAMRTIKSAAEIAVMREAGALSAAAVIEGMRIVRPGMYENRLQAAVEYTFRDQGHCGLGYGVIAAAGTRTWNGHYHFNNATIQEDEIVLLDCGPDLRHYSSDIARMFPANGVFGDWHRRIYGMIVQYHKELLDLIRPGVLVDDIYAEAVRRMLALCDKPAGGLPGMRPYVEQMQALGVGYLNHGVGLSVHDAMDKCWRTTPLREGFVCALDPMIWVSETHEYIRVEDTIVVTADGCERLTGAAPFEIDAIEAVMRAGRV
jgi:Xaa-Pro aminopeptidase